VRVTIDIRSAPDGTLYLHVGAGAKRHTRVVEWLPGKQVLVAGGVGSTVADPAGLARAVEHCDQDCDAGGQLAKLREYGELLFGAAFGPDASGQDPWQEFLRDTVEAGDDYLEVAVLGSPDADHAELQSLRWEALHDGERFVAAQGTTDARIPVGIVRLVSASPGNGTPGSPAPEPIKHIPKVLYAVGSHLTDQDVRSGAEFMGIMRRLDRHGGSVQARLLDRATRAGLLHELATFRPDVLHLIGHGQWFPDGVKVQLRGERRGDDDWVLAEDLLDIFEKAHYRPTMVVLSACQTASTVRASALPYAARLVAGNGLAGVPVVVAMAGDISDTACRVFTQALTWAIGHGERLGKAVTMGRGAAFHGGPGPVSGHWVMPVVFLAGQVPEKACLVNTARTDAARLRVHRLDMAREPVFCGRTAFFAKYDKLLEASDPLNVLLGYMPASDPDRRFGGKRLLQELGARAVRSDVLPVMLGPFHKQPPQDLKGLTHALNERFAEMRAHVPGFRSRKRASRAVQVAEAGGRPFDVAEAIRWDLDKLVMDLDPGDPVRQRGPGQPRTVLLCHRVDMWLVLEDLLDLLGPTGLKGGPDPVPVMLTGMDVDPVNYAREHAWAGPPSWINCLPLDRLTTDKDKGGNLIGEAVQRSDEAVVKDEDLLAYRWWMLNPPPGERVYALSRTAPPGWPGLLRHVLKDAAIYPGEELFDLARVLTDYFTSADDDALLATYAEFLQ
jgi:CHAT domain